MNRSKYLVILFYYLRSKEGNPARIMKNPPYIVLLSIIKMLSARTSKRSRFDRLEHYSPSPSVFVFFPLLCVKPHRSKTLKTRLKTKQKKTMTETLIFPPNLKQFSMSDSLIVASRNVSSVDTVDQTIMMLKKRRQLE